MKSSILLFSTITLLTACQVKRGLLETPDFNRQESLFFVHSDQGGLSVDDHIFLDGQELNDFETLDQQGVKVKKGKEVVKS